MPHLQKLYQRHQNRGLAIVGVNLNDERETVRAYLSHSGVTFPVGLDREQDLEKPPSYGTAERYQVTAVPATFVLDRKGIITFRTSGLDFPGLDAALKRLGIE